MFKCDRCGLCCMNLGLSEIYKDLDRGDGICIYFDQDTRLCTIYEKRPLKCDVDRMYENYFKNYMTREEYYKLNYEACKKLKSI